jgi:hypothetical protein
MGSVKALERFNKITHSWWYNPINWQRRTVLVLFGSLTALPVFLLIAIITAVFACAYIPFMFIMYGWHGYQDAVSDLADVIMDPASDLIYLMRGIWIAPWDRSPASE